MYFATILWALLAWIIGLFIDGNLGYGESLGFTEFRILLPLIAVALCIIYVIKKSSNKE